MDKSSFRKKIYDKIAAFDESYIIYSDEVVFKKLITLPEVLLADTVFTYMSMGREVDTQRLIRFCISRGKRVALPVVVSDGKMEFHLIKSLDELVCGTFGISEPSNSTSRINPTENDICIVPALCYDVKLHRLGRGGGYYDRFLADCKTTKTIGLCRERLVCNEVPTQPHDIAVSLLITEEKKRGR